jgi:cytochrome c oxidase cbb3-type subunit 4
MDINILRGAILLVLIFSFLGLWAWAWSAKRKSAFNAASRLPLEEDQGEIPNDLDPTNETRPKGQGVSHVN